MTNAIATLGESINNTNDHLVEYEVHDIRALSATSHSCPKTGKKSIHSVTVDDRPVHTSQRFWTSLFSRYGFGKNVFNYFEPEEVFERIAERRPDDSVRFCLHANPDAKIHTLLAVSSPNKPVLQYDQVRELLERYNPLIEGTRFNDRNNGVLYSDGILRANYSPRGESGFEISGDVFQPQFSTMVPIDGYGSSEVVLGCLRMVCTNGMVAIGRAFTNKIPGGSDAEGGMERLTQVIESYGNDEGYDAFRRRLQSATESHASVAECMSLSRTVGTAMSTSGASHDNVRTMLDRLDTLAGSPSQFYGLIAENSVGRKRLASLPTKATVYDMLNFATEVVSHHVKNEVQARVVHGQIGTILSSEYDLEGSARGNKDPMDMFMSHEERTKTEATLGLSAPVINPELN